MIDYALQTVDAVAGSMCWRARTKNSQTHSASSRSALLCTGAGQAGRPAAVPAGRTDGGTAAQRRRHHRRPPLPGAWHIAQRDRRAAGHALPVTRCCTAAGPCDPGRSPAGLHARTLGILPASLPTRYGRARAPADDRSAQGDPTANIKPAQILSSVVFGDMSFDGGGSCRLASGSTNADVRAGSEAV